MKNVILLILPFLLSRPPSVETLGYLLSRRTALVHSTAPRRFENQFLSRPTTPPSALGFAQGRLRRRLSGPPGEALALASGALIRGAQLRLSCVDLSGVGSVLISISDVPSAAKAALVGRLIGTDESVPFQNRMKLGHYAAVISGCSSSSKTPTQGQTKALNGTPAALNGAPAATPIVGSRLS